MGEVIAEAYVMLKQEDTESYFRTMEKNIKNMMCWQSRERFIFLPGTSPECRPDFEKEHSCGGGRKGGSLVLSREPKAIEDGFILVYGGIEEKLYLKGVA